MPQNELLVDVLRRDPGMLQMAIADLSDADLLQRPVPTANNAIWQLGHLIASEAFMVNAAAGKTLIELPAGFTERFNRDTCTVDDASKLATKAELLALMTKVREQTCAWIATLTPADMAKPAPEQLIRMIPTVGHLAHLFPVHAAMHLGQVQVLRRKLGKPILF